MIVTVVTLVEVIVTGGGQRGGPTGGPPGGPWGRPPANSVLDGGTAPESMG